MKTLILVATLLLLVACQPNESVINESVQLITLDEHELTCVYMGAYQGGLSCDWETYHRRYGYPTWEPQKVAELPVYCRHVALWHDDAEARECMDLYNKELGL